MDGVLHDVYLPFDQATLNKHFATVVDAADPDRHVRYYQASVAAWQQFQQTASSLAAADRRAATSKGLQIEKDERFWVAAALLGLYYGPDRIQAFTRLLRYALGPTPPLTSFDSWEQALGAEQFLFFEANLPSPPAYRSWLADHLDERILIPHIRHRADTVKTRLEGSTKVDAILMSPSTGFAVLFEAKVLSDVSGTVAFDVLRNQLARIIDVSLDAQPQLEPRLASRQPERTCVVLLTPEVFRRHPSSRLYGWLLPRYRVDAGLLAEHLPHRSPAELNTVTARLGWATWEDCNRSQPNVCRWLPPEPHAAREIAQSGDGYEP